MTPGEFKKFYINDIPVPDSELKIDHIYKATKKWDGARYINEYGTLNFDTDNLQHIFAEQIIYDPAGLEGLTQEEINIVINTRRALLDNEKW